MDIPHPRVDRRLVVDAWHNFFSYDSQSATPAWLRLVLTGVFALGIAAVFTLLSFGLNIGSADEWRHWANWVHWYRLNLVISLSISLAIFALFSVLIPLIGKSRVREWSGGRRRLFFSAVPLLGVAIGWPLGLSLIGGNLFDMLGLSSLDQALHTLALVVLISWLFNLVFNAKARQIEAERRAAESQLRLLQGQIEPHFLFNTLANVISLIDHDAPRARQMLESFTDYLRSSLTSLRNQRATLGTELDLVQAYLCLLGVRMEDRLQFSIEVDPQLRNASLPPLLLQPLVENAIHHGLEPKVEGGRLRVSAHAEGGMLELEVADDGMGLGAPSRRRGAGVALANLRERLQARYGSTASLVLAPAQPGTRATLRLPLHILKPTTLPEHP